VTTSAITARGTDNITVATNAIARSFMAFPQWATHHIEITRRESRGELCVMEV
jgi:hypothetical protein